MLIKCPECGNEVSDKSEKCIYCGLPMNKSNCCIINGVEYDLSDELQMILNNGGIASVIHPLRMKYKLSLEDAMELYNIMNSTKEIPATFDQQNVSPSTMPTIPRCPVCQSTNIRKISGISKAGSVALFGIFSVGKVSKQWHCNNCKSEF